MKAVWFVMLVLLSLGGVVVARHALGWRSDAERWLVERDGFREQVVALRADSIREAAVREALTRQTDAALDSVAAARRVLARADSSYRSALLAARREPAPPECTPIVVAYEAVIARADSVIAAERAIASHEREARRLGEAMVASLQRENAGLRATLARGTDLIETAPVRPRRIPDWLAVGPGVTAQGVSPVVVSVNVLPTVERIARAVGGWF